MSPGHIYHYFQSKEQIVSALIQQHVEKKQAELKAMVGMGSDPVESLIEVLTGRASEKMEPFWSTLMLEIVAESTRSPEVAGRLRQLAEDGREMLSDMLSDDVRVNDLNERLELLLALAQGLGMRSLVSSDCSSDKIRPLVREIVLTLFK